MGAAIEMTGVTRRFGDTTALDSLDLTVPPGATYGLLGPNGAGKTTAIRILLHILAPDRGTVRVLGEPVRRGILDRVGYLPEERGLYQRMSARALLSFLAELKGVSRTGSAPRIEGWLERFDLGDRADDRVQELSKGMQQKLQFIAAVLHEPELVLLDEPFSGLDPINQRVLREVVADLQRQGRTILFCTHLIEHAERLCDHVCILSRGRKIVDGPLADVRRAHGGTYVAIALDGTSPDGSEEAMRSIREAPGVQTVSADGRELEVGLVEGGDSDALLAWLVGRGIRIRRFERVEPSLHQIFIERVGIDPVSGEEEADA